MDLSSLDVAKASNEGFDVRLFHPVTNVELDSVIRVLGRDSDKFKAVQAEQNRKRIARMSRGGMIRPGVLSLQELDSDTIDLLAACTVSWTNVSENGKAIEFSAENAKTLYRKYSWIREQVEAGVNDRANFMPLSQNS